MNATTDNGSRFTTVAKQLARASVAAPVIAWVLGLCFSTPDPSLVPAKVIADVVRAGFFGVGTIFAIVALVEVGRRGTSGILLAGLVGLGFNGLGVCGAFRHLPDEVRIYRAGNAAAEFRAAAAGLDFQNLANPNLLKDKASLEGQRARLERFLVTGRRATAAIAAAKEVLVGQTSVTDPALDRKTAVIQDINGKLERCDREIKLAEAAVNMLDLLTEEWGRWKMPLSGRDPVFDVAETARRYKTLDQAMFAAEQSLAAVQQQTLGYSVVHPGERILSVTTFNPPLPVQARTMPGAAVGGRSATPASFANVVDYAKLDFEKPEEAAESATESARNLTGEDAQVMQAWSGVLSNLVAASREVQRSAKVLVDADVLNGSTVARQGSVPVSQQFVNRRGIANKYGQAVDAWQKRVMALSGQYLGELYRCNVSPERSQIERSRLDAAIGEKAKLQLKICAVEREVALGYNRAVSNLEMYQQYTSSAQPGPANNNSAVPTRPLPWERTDSPNPGASQYGKQLAEQVAKIEELKRSLQQLRQ